MVFELPKIWCRPHAEVAARVVEVHGWEEAEVAQRAGRGIIFLTPHLGCFDVSAQYIATQLPLTVLYRAPKQRWLQPLMEEGRGRGERLRLAPADLSGVRKLIGVLRKGGAIGLLPDQAPGAGEGKWLPFFGRPAYTMTLTGRLQESSGAALVFCFAERLADGRGFRLRLRAREEPLPADRAAAALAVNRGVEELVRLAPEQYLWGYNRYKRPAGAPPAPGAIAWPGKP